MANLASLPAEIIIYILQCDDISQQGLKSLRLLCQKTCGPATLALFSRICISKLKSDRDAFLNIAAQPHLAPAVRTVVWLELAEDELSFVHMRNPRRSHVRLRNSRSRSVFGSDAPHMLDELSAQVREMFWLPFEDLNRYTDELAEVANKRARTEARAKAVETLMPLFFAALDSMPKLATFVSQPMHPLRELAMPPGSAGTPGYPMTAQILQRGQYAAHSQMNEGLCTFILPYMLHRANSSRLSPITSLHFADEGNFSFVTRITPAFARSFTGLSRLDLCVSYIRSVDDLTELAQCLKAAENLTELRLCFERCKPPGRSDILDAVVLPTSQWPKLRLLHLDDVPLVTSSLVRVVKGLVESLRVLRFDYCPLTLHTLVCLAKIQGLKLERFISTGKCPYDESKHKFEPLRGNYQYEEEEHVLQFLESNGKIWYLNSYQDCYIYTSAGAYDLCGWRTAALFHSRAVRFKYLNGQSSYSIVERRELEQENDIANDVQDDSSNEDDDAGSAAPASDSVEKASNEKRILSAPRWNWQQADQEIYYWKVTHLDEGQIGYPTELWRFTHRNGESAVGNDPLEF